MTAAAKPGFLGHIRPLSSQICPENDRGGLPA
jgi:hypothetical protein